MVSFLGSFCALLGEGSFAFGALVFQRAVSVIHFSFCLVNPSPLRDLAFSLIWKIKILDMVKFLFGRFFTWG